MLKIIILGIALILLASCGGDEPISQDEAAFRSIIDMEEAVQKSNYYQNNRAQGYYFDIHSELASIQYSTENKHKREKLQNVLNAMDKINLASGKMIKYIDDLKMELLQAGGESIIPNNNAPKSIVWKSYDKKNPCNPARLNLNAIKELNNSEVISKVFGSKDPLKPSSNGIKLWNKFIEFRKSIVQITGAYEWAGKKFNFNNYKNINSYANTSELRKSVSNMLESNSINKYDDFEVLMELYLTLTKQEKTGKMHWINARFNENSLVGSIATLTTLQQDILSARVMAMAHWKSKVSSSEYGFNKIMPLAYGPQSCKPGETVELQVMMAAYDSENQPVVTTTFNGADIKSNGNGIGIVTLTPKKGTNSIRGTVGIRNKTGALKLMEWEHVIEVSDK